MIKRIEICGGIASGKTTLANILKTDSNIVINERFEDNPFLWDFYQHKEIDNSFETEVCFTLQHYNLIKKQLLHGNLICDFSLLQDYSYAKANLNFDEFHVYESMYKFLHNKIGSPILLIYLRCDVNTLVERIKCRGRTAENTISSDYLKHNIDALENIILNNSNLLIIDSEKLDFRNDKKEYVIKQISERI